MKLSVCDLVCRGSVLAILLLTTGVVAQGEVVVQDADLTSNNTQYRLAFLPQEDFGKMNEPVNPENSALMKGSLVSANNLRYIVEPGQSIFIAPYVNTQTTADMVLGWDFTKSSYRPKSVELTNIVVLFAADAGNTSVATLSWSVDGKSWTEYAKIEARQFSYNQAETVMLPSPDHFYVKVEFSEIGPTQDTQKDQWGRVSMEDPAAEAFSAVFLMGKAGAP